jgi:hypothetical protein
VCGIVRVADIAANIYVRVASVDMHVVMFRMSSPMELGDAKKLRHDAHCALLQYVQPKSISSFSGLRGT